MDSADFDAMEEEAKARLSPGAYAFAAGGADDEIALRGELVRTMQLCGITSIDEITRDLVA